MAAHCNKNKYTKCLWVIIDEYLIWAEHINTVKQEFQEELEFYVSKTCIENIEIVYSLW